MALLRVNDSLFATPAWVTPNIDDAVFDYPTWGAHASGPAPAVRGGVVQVPAPKSLDAIYVPAFSDVWYNRIHFIPSEVVFQDIAGTTQLAVVIWNAYFQQKTITNITKINLEGVSFLDLPPIVFGELQARSHLIEATLAGPVVDEGFFRFLFEHGLEVLPVKVTRANLFPWPHNWSEQISETFSFATEWIPSWSGEGQRIGLRGRPRRRVRMSHLVPHGKDAAGNPDPKERALLRGLLWIGQARSYGLPLWFDAQRLGAALPAGSSSVSFDTRFRDYRAGGSILFYQSPTSYELRGISDLTDSQIDFTSPTLAEWPSGTIIVPVRSAKPGPEIEHLRVTREIETLNAFEWEIETHEVSAHRFVAKAQDTYRGLPVFPWARNEAEDLPVSHNRPAVILDGGYGPRFVDEQGTSNIMGEEVRLLLSGHEEISGFLEWLHARDGSRVPFWYTEGGRDFRLASPVSPTDTNLTVEDWKYSAYYNVDSARRDIQILLPDGSRIYRRINAVNPGNPGEEVLTLDSQIGSSIAVEALSTGRARISFLRCCVIAGDEVEILWDTNEIVITAFRIRDLRETA